MIGVPPAAALAARITCGISAGASEKNSPVPPPANSAAGPYPASHSTCALYASALKRSSKSKWVTGNDRRPELTAFFNRIGSTFFNLRVDRMNRSKLDLYYIIQDCKDS